MSNVGQAALGIIGAVVGSVIPGLGTVMGAQLGLMVGGWLFPTELPDAHGPRIEDGGTLPAVVGAPIALSWGTVWLRGTPIWVSDYVEHDNTETAGGKGGPEQEVHNYTYTRSLAVLFGEGEKQGLLALRRNGEVKYDLRPQRDGETDAAFQERIAASEAFAEQMEVYLGTEAQLPDPTMEAVEGAGMVPAHRGMHYIVFTDHDVTDTRTLPPQWDAMFAEVATEDEITDTTLAALTLAPWRAAAKDPRNPENDHTYQYVGYGGPGSSSGPVRATLAEALEDGIADISADYANDAAIRRTVDLLPDDLNLIGWSRLATTNGSNDGPGNMYPATAPDAEELVNLYMQFSEVEPDAYYDTLPWHSNDGIAEFLCQWSGSVLWWTRRFENQVAQTFHTTELQYQQDYDAPPIYATAVKEEPADGLGACAGQGAWRIPMFLIRIERVPRKPDRPCAPRTEDQPYLALPENPTGFCVLPDGSMESQDDWASHSASYKWLSLYATSGTPTQVSRYPLGPVVLVGSADDNQTFWDAAYAAAVADGKIVAGLTYSSTGGGGVNTYPRTSSSAYRRQVTRTEVSDDLPTLGSIVQALCERADIDSADIDVSELTRDLGGYLINRQTTARQALEQLQLFGQFDVVEGAQLRFPLRGQAVVRTFTLAQLGAHNAGQPPPPRVLLNRTQPVELPKLVTLQYLSRDNDGQPNGQQDAVQVTTSKNRLDLSLPIGMTDDEARQLVQILNTQARIGSEEYEIAIGPANIDLEPGDAINIPIGGVSTRACIVEVTGGLPGLMRLRVRRDEAFALVSYLTGVPGTAGDVGPRLRGPSYAWYLDLPMLLDSHNDAGYYAAVRGLLSGWLGCTFYREEGSDYTTVVPAPIASTVGAATTALAEGRWDIFDYDSTVQVLLDHGSLETRTEDEVLAGANVGALEVRDENGDTVGWEILQWVTATLDDPDTYTLSQLLRGRKGTEWAMGLHAVGDRFVLLTGPLYRLPAQPDALDQARNHKAVSNGTAIGATDAVPVTAAGVALQPLSPVNIVAEQDGFGNVDLTWQGRTRFGRFWWTGGPLGEEVEQYELEVYRGLKLVDEQTVYEPSARLSTTPVELAVGLRLGMFFDSPVGESSSYLFGYRVTRGFRPFAHMFRLDKASGVVSRYGLPAISGYRGGFTHGSIECIGSAAFVQVTSRDPDPDIDDLYFSVMKMDFDFAQIAQRTFLSTEVDTTLRGRPLVSDGTNLWHGQRNPNQVARLNQTTLANIAAIALPGRPEWLEVAGSKLWVATSDGSITRISTLTFTLEATIALTAGYTAVYLHYDGTALWVLQQSHTDDDILEGYDPSTGALLFQAEVAGKGCGMGDHYYFCDGSELVALSNTTGAIVKTHTFTQEEVPHAYLGIIGRVTVDSELRLVLQAVRAPDRFDEIFQIPTPHAYYLGAESAGALGDDITIRIYQISAVVGRGKPGEVTL